MKLQSKKQLNNQFQETRRQEIEEGVKLAKKIDVLRETLASLEKQHETFLAGMGRELDEKTKEQRLEIARLQSEIKQLEERRKVLLAPIDDEWVKLEEAKQKLEEDKSLIDIESNELQKKKQGIEEEEERLGKVRETIKNDRDEADRVTRETNELNIQARKYRDDLKSEYDNFIKESTEKTNELKIKERSLNNLEKYYGLKEKRLNSKEEFLKRLEIKLKDRSERLKKTLKELNKK